MSECSDVALVIKGSVVFVNIFGLVFGVSFLKKVKPRNRKMSEFKLFSLVLWNLCVILYRMAFSIISAQCLIF